MNLTQGSHTGEARSQLEGLGSAVSYPSGVWGRGPENFDFFLHIWDPQNAK